MTPHEHATAFQVARACPETNIGRFHRVWCCTCLDGCCRSYLKSPCPHGMIHTAQHTATAQYITVHNADHGTSVPYVTLPWPSTDEGTIALIPLLTKNQCAPTPACVRSAFERDFKAYSIEKLQETQSVSTSGPSSSPALLEENVDQQTTAVNLR